MNPAMAPASLPVGRVEAAGPAFAEAAAALAASLGLALTGEADYVLRLGPAGLALQELGPQAPGPLLVDLVLL